VYRTAVLAFLRPIVDPCSVREYPGGVYAPRSFGPAAELWRSVIGECGLAGWRIGTNGAGDDAGDGSNPAGHTGWISAQDGPDVLNVPERS